MAAGECDAGVGGSDLSTLAAVGSECACECDEVEFEVEVDAIEEREPFDALNECSDGERAGSLIATTAGGENDRSDAIDRRRVGDAFSVGRAGDRFGEGVSGSATTVCFPRSSLLSRPVSLSLAAIAIGSRSVRCAASFLPVRRLARSKLLFPPRSSSSTGGVPTWSDEEVTSELALELAVRARSVRDDDEGVGWCRVCCMMCDGDGCENGDEERSRSEDDDAFCRCRLVCGIVVSGDDVAE